MDASWVVKKGNLGKVVSEIMVASTFQCVALPSQM